MNAGDVVALIAAAVEAIARLIAGGVSKDVALERIRAIAADVQSLRADADGIAAGD
jgi:hypothetical protein